MSEFQNPQVEENSSYLLEHNIRFLDKIGRQAELLRMFDRLPVQDQVQILALARSKLKLREVYGAARSDPASAE